MRDKAKDEMYFSERFNEDSENLKEILDDFHNDIEIGEYPEKFNIRVYKYQIFIEAFYKFYSGYSLGLGHVGNHCHNGCDLKDDIDKDNNKWNGNAREKSTCVMFGSANGKESFCSECAMQVRKVDLSEGVY